MVVAQYLLTFREVLEAALLAAIILAFLGRMGHVPMRRYAWYGIYGAVAASLGVGAGIWILYGELSESSQVLFEGLAALLAVAVLTSMIYWMAARSRTIKQQVEGRVEAAVTRGAILGLASVTFVLVFREGLETVLFLTPFLLQDPTLTLLGAALGLGAGVGLAYGIFRVGIQLDIRRFFYFTSILLILLAGGLLGYGVHELIEYGEIQGVEFGWLGTRAYDLGLFGGDATTPPDPFHQKGYIGSIFAVLLGYSQNPEWARLIAHLAYLAVALPLVILIYKKPEVLAAASRRIRAIFRPGRAAPVPREE